MSARSRVRRSDLVHARLLSLAHRPHVPQVVQRLPTAWEDLGEVVERLLKHWDEGRDPDIQAFRVRKNLHRLVLTHELVEEELTQVKLLVAGLPIRTYWRPKP